MKRGIIIGVVAVVAVLGIGVFVLYSSLGDLIKAAVERVGSEATQASVTLDGVDLDATSGKGALRGFKVGNPKGFETPAAFTLGSVSLHLDAGKAVEEITKQGEDAKGAIEEGVGAAGDKLKKLLGN